MVLFSMMVHLLLMVLLLGLVYAVATAVFLILTGCLQRGHLTGQYVVPAACCVAYALHLVP